MKQKRTQEQKDIFAVVGDKMYRQPFTVASLRELKNAGIDISEYCDFDPDAVLLQAEFAREVGVTRQEINRRVQDGQCETIEYNGRVMIVNG